MAGTDQLARPIPPPPRFAQQDPEFNRWLVNLISFISTQGGIEAQQIQGIQSLLAAQQAQIEDLTRRLQLTNSAVAVLGNRLTFGTVAPVSTIGDNGDWYASTLTGKGVYVKQSGSWVLVAS